ncbi:MAG: hypothetical protein ABH827_02990 [bacterium]
MKVLQAQQQDKTQELDLALQFYYEKIRPDEVILQGLFIERVTIAYQIYKTSKDFSKAERKDLKKIVMDEVNVVFSLGDGYNIPVEVKEIFSDLNGVDYDETLAAELELFEDENQMASSRRESKKTKKQREKESKKSEFEALLKQNINSTYKQLARVLHPDLEQNSEQKIVKEELMKTLTIAYKNNDLYELLNLELECLKHSASTKQTQNNEKLEIYNTVLADQVKTLQVTIDTLFQDPKYAPLGRYYNDRFNGIFSLKFKYEQLKNEVRAMQKFVNRLKTPAVVGIFKIAIKERRAMQR